MSHMPILAGFTLVRSRICTAVLKCTSGGPKLLSSRWLRVENCDFGYFYRAISVSLQLRESKELTSTGELKKLLFLRSTGEKKDDCPGRCTGENTFRALGFSSRLLIELARSISSAYLFRILRRSLSLGEPGAVLTMLSGRVGAASGVSARMRVPSLV